MTNNIEPSLYTMEVSGERIHFKLIDAKMPMTERMRRALVVPDAVNITRPLTDEEDSVIGYINLLNKPPVYMKSKAGDKDIDLGYANYVTPKKLYDAGQWQKMIRAQEILANPDFITFLEKQQAKGGLTDHKKRRGDCYDLGVSHMPTHSGIQLGRAARGVGEHADELQELNIILATLYKVAVEISGFDFDNRKHWATNASINFGHQNQLDATSSQVNYKKVGTTTGEALKQKGHLHTDGNDDPTRPTAVLFLSNLPEEIYEGRFIMSSIKVHAPGERFGILVMSARAPHGGKGIGQYPEGFDVNSIDTSHRPPQEVYPKLPEHFFKGRISVPIYSRLNNVKPLPNEVKDEIFTDQALRALGTRRNLQQLKLRTHIKKNLDTIKEQGTTADALCEMFSWTGEDGTKELPEKWIAEMAVEFGGQKIEEYEDRYKAAMYSSVGQHVPRERSEAEAIAHRAKLDLKKRHRKAVLPDGSKMVKVQCPVITKSTGQQCKHFYWPDPGCTMCKAHRKILAKEQGQGETVTVAKNPVASEAQQAAMDLVNGNAELEGNIGAAEHFSDRGQEEHDFVAEYIEESEEENEDEIVLNYDELNMSNEHIDEQEEQLQGEIEYEMGYEMEY